MKKRARLLLGSAAIPVLVIAALVAPASQVAAPASPIKNKVIQKEIAYELGQAKRPVWQQKLSSGVMYPMLMAAGVLPHKVSGSVKAVPLSGPKSSDTGGCANTYTGGIGQGNTRVNQDCSLRRQAEEAIAVNPTNRKNLIAGQNDSRVGFNQCGFDWSFDGGVHWGDMIPPFHQILLPNGHVGDFCSDPTVAFDSQGNAFAAGLELSIDGLASAIVVGRSDAGLGGSFYHDPDQADPFHQYKDTPMGVINAQFDEAGCTTNDKELMAADSSLSSPKADTLYMTWSLFDFCTGEGVGAHSPIDFSQSTDGGLTWSPAMEISGSNTAFCVAFSGESDPHACDQDQGSQPYVGKDGTLYVVFSNGNTTTAGINQKMMVKCPATADCSLPASWQGPYKVADTFDTQPTASITDPVTGCPAGRQCIPPNGYRMDDFVEVSISADQSGRLYVVWADGRNLGANCQGDYAAAAPPCDNDVFYSYSVDGGVTWQGPYDVTSTGGEDSAQWMPWSEIAPEGNVLWIGYYDRGYGSCETSGCNDVTLAKVDHPRSSRIITYRRLTTASMPNLVIANNPAQAGFLGDYMWVDVDNHGIPHVVWADTRGLRGSVEEDIYYSQ